MHKTDECPSIYLTAAHCFIHVYPDLIASLLHIIVFKPDLMNIQYPSHTSQPLKVVGPIYRYPRKHHKIMQGWKVMYDDVF